MRIIEQNNINTSLRSDNGRHDYKDESVQGAQDGTQVVERNGTADCYYAIRRLIEFSGATLNNRSENEGTFHTFWSENPSQFVEALRRLFSIAFGEERRISNRERFQEETNRLNNIISNVAGQSVNTINPVNPSAPIANSNAQLRADLQTVINHVTRFYGENIFDGRPIPKNFINAVEDLRQLGLKVDQNFQNMSDENSNRRLRVELNGVQSSLSPLLDRRVIWSGTSSNFVEDGDGLFALFPSPVDVTCRLRLSIYASSINSVHNVTYSFTRGQTGVWFPITPVTEPNPMYFRMTAGSSPAAQILVRISNRGVPNTPTAWLEITRED